MICRRMPSAPVAGSTSPRQACQAACPVAEAQLQFGAADFDAQEHAGLSSCLVLRKRDTGQAYSLPVFG